MSADSVVFFGTFPLHELAITCRSVQCRAKRRALTWYFPFTGVQLQLDNGSELEKEETKWALTYVIVNTMQILKVILLSFFA